MRRGDGSIHRRTVLAVSLAAGGQAGRRPGQPSYPKQARARPQSTVDRRPPTADRLRPPATHTAGQRRRWQSGDRHRCAGTTLRDRKAEGGRALRCSVANRRRGKAAAAGGGRRAAGGGRRAAVRKQNSRRRRPTQATWTPGSAGEPRGSPPATPASRLARHVVARARACARGAAGRLARHWTPPLAGSGWASQAGLANGRRSAASGHLLAPKRALVCGRCYRPLPLDAIPRALWPVADDWGRHGAYTNTLLWCEY